MAERHQVIVIGGGPVDVAEVQVRPAGVEPHLEAEGLALLEARDELWLGDDPGDAALGDPVDGLLIELGHG